jgi:hypothetical protein
MGRMNSEDAKLFDPVIMKGYKLNQAVIGAIGATYIITRDAAPLLFLALSSAQNVQMPANERGLTFRIINNSGGAFTITVKDSDTTPTRGTIAQNAAADIVSDGTRWWVLPLT